MKKYYLILLLFIPLFSIAQSNYKSGYVVNLKGDTLRGYINFKEWSYNPESIEFKTVLADKARELSLTDINYFEISSYVSYRSYTVSISTNPVDVSSPPAAIDTSSTTGNVFLKVLEKGKHVTLYSYKDNLKERFYIKENDAATPTELLYGIYQDPNNNNVVDKNTFQVQLLQVADKYNISSDKFIAQVQGSKYKDYVLIPIVAQINGSANEETAARSGKHNPPLRFFAGASFISSTLKFSDIADQSTYNGYSSSTSSSPKISLGLDLLPNPDVGHLVFRVELGYNQDKFSFHSQVNPIFNDANAPVYSESYKMNVIYITPQVIYNIYNEPMLKVFVDAGYSINILSYPAASLVTTEGGEVIATEPASGLDANRGNTSSFTFKGGVVISKRFEIYAEYFVGAQVTDSFDYNTNLSSYQVGVNYFIGKVAN